jgi:hypothetical protein
MRAKTKALIEQARALPAEDRILLLQTMLDSLEYSDPAMDRLWAQEAADRMAAYRRGEMAAKEERTVFEKHRTWKQRP